MRRATLHCAVAVGLVLATAAPVVAAGRPGDTAAQIRFGGFFLEGDGDLWDENEAVFTLEASDFDDFVLGLSLVYTLNNNLELGLNVDFYDETVLSQYQARCTSDPGLLCVDEFGFPILHDTELSLVPLTFDVRFLPTGRYRMRAGGRQVRKPVFYVGAGAGVNFWEYEEIGDFLDFTFDPPEIFPARFEDSGAAFELHALAGVELPLGATSNFLIEGRYSISDDDLGGDFAGLGEIELSGASLYGGLSFRF